jgi:hypothetical protein
LNPLQARIVLQCGLALHYDVEKIRTLVENPMRAALYGVGDDA